MKDFKQAIAAQFISSGNKQEVENNEKLAIEKNQEVKKHREELVKGITAVFHKFA
ncbi:hypothetical protein AGMMS50222_10680 [Endomicrobiia bacterium]|nr:hypothetical protein AGMMS49556_06070 [Endomicrobiia bacterium]GHT77269.1 hypothetical protein AGMMS50222_10680 [Endomicrobiia bacterium]